MRECDTCGHKIASDHGMQFVMLGECEDCPECVKLAQARVAEDRKARPAQYRPIETEETK